MNTTNSTFFHVALRSECGHRILLCFLALFSLPSCNPLGETSRIGTNYAAGVVIDSTPSPSSGSLPTVSITSPTSGSYSTDSADISFSASGSCSENGQSVSLSASDGINSSSATSICNTNNTPNWSTSINLSSLTPGTITLSATHTDSSGNVGSATSVTIVKKDVTPPNNASLLGWAETSPSNSNSVTASWTKSNSLDLTNQSIQYYSDATCATASGALVSAALNSTKVFIGTSGSWSYKVISYDNSGNSSTSACSSAIVLKEASLANSILEVTSSSIFKEQTSTITLRIKDSNGAQNTIGGYTVSFSTTSGGGISTGTLSSTTDNGDGTYTSTYTATAKGTAATISAAISGVGTVIQTQTITVENSAPTISAHASKSYPLDGSSPPLAQGASVTLASSTDADSDSVALSCTYQTLGLNALDPNFAALGTNCNNLDTITTSGSPATTVKGKITSPTTGALTWTPTYTQRGTYQFTINATDGTTNATSQTVTATIRANYTTTDLLSALDATNATNASGLSTSTPSAPFTSADTAGSFLSLISSASNGSLTYGTTNPWGGTGQSSISSIDPYALTFNFANSDSLSLGTGLSTATQFSTEVWVKPSPLPSASPASIIIGNGGSTGDGFVLRHSQIAPDYTELVIGQKYYSYQDLILSDKPIGYWRLDETTGTVSTDRSSIGNNGTYNSTFSLGTAGALALDSNHSATFNGSSSYVSAPNKADYSNATFSLEAWIKWNGTTYSVASTKDWAGIFSKGTNSSGEYSLSMRRDSSTPSTNTFNFYIKSSLRTSWTSTMNTNWHHIVALYDGSKAEIYFDGALKASTNVAVTTTATGNVLRLGLASATNSYYWGGALDEMAIYNYALTSQQIVEHYQTGLNGNYKPYPGNTILADHPLRYWRMNEKSGLVTNDISGNAGDLTYRGGITYEQAGALGSSGDSDSAIQFDGTTGYTSGSDSGLPNGKKPRSVVAWVNPTSLPASGRKSIITKWGTTTFYKAFLLFLTNISNTQYISLSGFNDDCKVASTLPTNAWTHLVGTFDGSVAKIYKDGLFLSSCTMSAWNTVVGSLYIGNSDNGSNQYFPGSIDEVAIYDYALSETQIAKQYNSGHGAGWWTCQSRVALDSSNWNLISTLYDGTIAKLFVNGKQECSVTPSSTYSSSVAHSVVGSNPDRTSNFWQGMLASVKLYGSSDGSAPATALTIKADFDSEANQYRAVPLENIVTDGLALNLDAANAKNGLLPYSNGCANSDLSWFDLAGSTNGTLLKFADCGTYAWQGDGTTGSPYTLAFDGSTAEYVAFESQPSLAITGDMTLEAWMKPTDLSSFRGILGKSTTGNLIAPYGWEINTIGRSILILGNGATQGSYQSSSGVTANSWVHLAVTLSGTSITHYKNGAINGTATNANARADQGNRLLVGTSANNIFSKFKGSLPIVRIYNRALTFPEIRQNCLAQELRFTSTANSICAN